MSALTDFLKKNVGSSYGGTVGKAFLATDAAGIITADNKFKSILKTVKDIAFFRIIWPTALLGALSGIQTVFRHIVVDSGSLAAALDRIRTISTYQGQFEPLLKGVAQAKQRVAELIIFASKSPFNLDSIVQASRSLEIFSKGALGSVRSLKLVENIARASGTGIEAAADAFGGFYRALENKEPIAKASEQIQQMGLLSTQTAEKLQRLQNTGASFAQIWLTAEEAIKANSKQTDKFSNSIEGLSKQLAEQHDRNKAAFAEKFIPGEQVGAKLSLTTAKNVEPILSTLGSTLAEVSTVGANFTKWIAKTLTGVQVLAPAIGALAKLFALLLTGLGITAFGKGVEALYELAKALTTTTAALSKTAVAGKLTQASIDFLEKSTKAADNGHRILSKGYEMVGKVTGKASTAIGGLTLSLRGLAVAAATNPIAWIAAAVAAVSVIWQLNEATNAAAKSLADLGEVNADLLHSNKSQVDAIESEDDAYAALAKTTQDVIEARKKLKELGPHEEAGFLEKVAPVVSGNEDIFGIKNRREMRNAERDLQEMQVGSQQALSKKVQQRISSGELAPSKEKQAVLEETAGRQVRLDQMERENRIQLATGHEKLRLMEQERVIEQGKGTQGEGAATARAELEGKTQEIIARRGELSDKEIRKRMVEAARTSSSEIIREEQRVREMAPGAEKEKASLAVAVKRKDIEQNRTEHIEKAVSLEPAIAQGRMEQRLADVRLVAEEKIAELKTVGVERAKQEYAIKIAALDATMKAQIAAGRPEEARATRAEMQSARQEQFERSRGVEVTRAQFQLELEQHATRREGKTQQSQKLEDIGAFLSHFEELRSQFGAPEAQKMALEKRKDELMEAQSSQVSPVVASSLQSIGGGGGVYGVSADSVQRVQERIRDLAVSSNEILQHIDDNTKETAKAGTPEIPTVNTVTEASKIAQQPEPIMAGPASVPATITTAPAAAPATTAAPAVATAVEAHTSSPAIPIPHATPAMPHAPPAPAAIPTSLPGPLVRPQSAPTTPEQREAMIRIAHQTYGKPTFGPVTEEPTPVEPATPQPTPAPWAQYTGEEKPANRKKSELDVLQAKSPANSLTVSLDALQARSNNLLTENQSAPFSPSPNRLQKAMADREGPEEALPIGPNFHAIQVLRTLKDIYESHVESNDHLDTIAGKEAGVQ